MLGTELLSDSARGVISDTLLIAAVVTAVIVPAMRWMQHTTREIVRREMQTVRDAVEGHQRTLEGIARNELAQLLPNGGSSMRDALDEIRAILRTQH